MTCSDYIITHKDVKFGCLNYSKVSCLMLALATALHLVITTLKWCISIDVEGYFLKVFSFFN